MKYLVTLLITLGLTGGTVTATAGPVSKTGQDVIEQNINNVFNPYPPAGRGQRSGTDGAGSRRC